MDFSVRRGVISNENLYLLLFCIDKEKRSEGSSYLRYLK